MNINGFDCVEMKRKGAEVVQKQIAGMSLREELDYWRRKTDALRQRQTRLK
jgi:hypothetical protein